MDKQKWVKYISMAEYDSNVKKTLKEITDNIEFIDIIELFKNVDIKNVTIEDELVGIVVRFLEKVDKTDGSKLWSLIDHLHKKNKPNIIEKLIPPYLKKVQSNEQFCKRNLVPLFARMKFLFVKIMRNRTPNLQLVKQLTSYMLNLLDISTPQSYFIMLNELLNFNFFQLLYRYNVDFCQNLMEKLSKINPKIEKRNTSDDFCTLTKLIAELFVEKMNLNICIKYAEIILKNIRNQYCSFNKSECVSICDLLASFLKFIKDEKDFTIFETQLKMTPKDLYLFDATVTICEILCRIFSEYKLNVNKSLLNNYSSITDSVVSNLNLPSTKKTFCSQCTNSKRHAVLHYSNFYINISKTFLKNNLEFIVIDNAIATRIVNTTKYIFLVLDSFDNCPKKNYLQTQAMINSFNLMATLSLCKNTDLNRYGVLIGKILMNNIKKIDQRQITIQQTLNIILNCYKNINLDKYLELYSFLIAIMVAEQQSKSEIVRNLQILVQQCYTDDLPHRSNLTILDVIDSIKQPLFDIPKPKVNRIDLLLLKLEAIGVYSNRNEIRKLLLQQIFTNIKIDPIQTANFLISYEKVATNFLENLIDLYSLIEKDKNTNGLILGLLKFKIYFTKFSKLIEKRKDMNYLLEFKDSKDFENDTLSTEMKFVVILKDSLEILKKHILENNLISNSSDLDYLTKSLYLIGKHFHLRNFKKETVNTYGLLYILSKRLNNLSGIISSFEYFLENFDHYYIVDDDIKSILPDFKHFKESNIEIIKNQLKMNNTKRINEASLEYIEQIKLVSCYLSYAKYVIKHEKSEDFLAIIYNITEIYPELITLNEKKEISYINTRFLHLLIYYKINNLSLENSLPILYYLFNFYSKLTKIKYNHLQESIYATILIIEITIDVSEFLMGKRLLFEIETYVNLSLKLALRYGISRRITQLLKISGNINILTENFEKVKMKIANLHTVMENETDLICKEKEEKIYEKKLEIRSPLSYVLDDCAVIRDFSVHVDEVLGNFPSPGSPDYKIYTDIHKFNCKCVICQSDLTTKLIFFEIGLLEGQLNYYNKNYETAKDIYEKAINNLEKHTNFYERNCKAEYYVNRKHFIFIKVSLNENLGKIKFNENNYEESKKLFIKAINNYKQIEEISTIGYYQILLITLKLIQSKIEEMKYTSRNLNVLTTEEHLIFGSPTSITKQPRKFRNYNKYSTPKNLLPQELQRNIKAISVTPTPKPKAQNLGRKKIFEEKLDLEEGKQENYPKSFKTPIRILRSKIKQ